MNVLRLFFLMIVFVACNGAPPIEDPRIDDDRLIREGKKLFAPYSLQLIEPVASPSFIARPKIKVDGVTSGNTVSIFSNANCLNPLVSDVANSNSITLQLPKLAYGSYAFYAKQSNVFTESDCTPFSLSYEYVQSVLAPSKVELISPSTAINTDKNPIVRVHGVSAGATVQVYADALCSVMLGQATATQSNIDIALSNLNPAVYKFYAKLILSSGISSQCTSTNESVANQYASYTITATTPSISSIVLTSPTSYPSPNKRPTFSVSGTIPGGTVKIFRDPTCLLEIGSAAITTTTTSVTVSSDLADGAHQIFARQFDSLNNASICSSLSNKYADYAVDSDIRQINQIVLLSPLSNYSTNSSIQVRVRGAESGASVTVYRNTTCTTFGGTAIANSAGDATITISGLVEGTHQFSARQIDTAGNISNCTGALLTYTRDISVSPPTSLTLINPVTNFNQDNTPEIKVDGIEVGATAYLYLDSSCMTPNLSIGSGSARAQLSNTFANVTSLPLSTGAHTIYARQVDMAGNRSDCSSASINYTVTAIVVAEPTSVQMSTPSANQGTNRNPTVSVSGLIVGGTVKLYTTSTCSNASLVAEKTITATTELLTVQPSSILAEGEYNFYALQFSAGGVASSCSNAAANYKVDLSAVAPTSIVLTSPAQASSNISTPKFLISGLESGARARLYRDNSCSNEVGTAVAANGASSVEITISPLSIAGTYSFYAKQIDSLGNVSPCSSAYANYQLVSLGTAPTNIVMISPASNLGNDATPTVRVSGVGVGHTVQVFKDNTCLNKVGEAVASNVTVDITLSTIGSDASYTFYAKQKDLQNTFSACSNANVSYILDTVALAPSSLSLINPVSSPSSVRTPIIMVSGIETGASVSLFSNSTCTTSIGSGTANTTSVNITTSSLNDGTYSIYARQIDSAGNTSSCSSQFLNYVVVSSVAAPTGLSLVTPASSPSTVTTPTILVSGVINGATVRLHTNSSCTNQVGSAVASGTTVQIQTSALAPTTHTIYAQQTNASNITSPCSSNFLTYQVTTSSDVISDPLFSNQWHLLHNGQNGYSGTDINVTPVWGTGAKGAGVLFRVVDDGMEISHEDLSINYSGTYSWNAKTNNSNPSHTALYYHGTTIVIGHGTSVAGLIAARDNSIGVRGVAPRATLSGYNLLEVNSDSATLDSATRSIANIDVSNNSWGPADGYGQFNESNSLWKSAIETGLSTGRGGKGTIYVWAAGNGAPIDNSNYDGFANLYGVIPVAALMPDGQFTEYSEAGSNVWISAPVGGFGPERILSTDRTGGAGYSNTNYSLFNGTSAAAPMVSGVVGLMLEANPNLGWRDVKIILAQTAKKNHPNSSGWKVNGAGYNINEDYGFGLVDAAAAVALAKNWTNVGTFQQQYQPTGGVQTANATIPSNGASAATSSIIVASSSVSSIEFISVDVNITHGNWGDLDIILKKNGNNFQSNLAKNHTCLNESGITSVCAQSSWTFGVARHLGESPVGTWTIEVWDKKNNGFSGTLNSWRLRFHGED
jgi:proprotein convertase subtilisin/kexin type 2